MNSKLLEFQRCLSLVVLCFWVSTFVWPHLQLHSQEAHRAVSMPDFIRQFDANQNSLNHKYRILISHTRQKRFDKFYQYQMALLSDIKFDTLSQDGKLDYLLLRREISHELKKLQTEKQKDDAAKKLIPFWNDIEKIGDKHTLIKPIEPKKLAIKFDELVKEIKKAKTELQDSIKSEAKYDKIVALRAANKVDQLRRSLSSVHKFHDGYDPLYTWWTKKPYADFDSAIKDYSNFVRENIVGVSARDKTTIIGEPIGKKALRDELDYEFVCYSPAELVEIANEQFKWCDREMEKATKAMGYDDWRKAQNAVKNKHVKPGEQPQMIKMLALEAIEFLEKRDLLTIPDLAKEVWRMEMMSPERQKVSPYFLGGPTIIVSFPTDTMSHADKLMSMRGNNIHFARATVHHELIPGHHLQHFMTRRHRQHRRMFSTPFWIEGWALYWEMRLYDLSFPKTPEDKIGMLFWRKHRCARIIFSLNYHLGKWSPQECIEFLVRRVGHERNNATAEVRRSVMGGYGPLYQAAYMLGGLQIRALHRELVKSGKMTEKEFHDSILKENSIPIELLRAKLTNQKLTKDFATSWRFND